MAAAVTIIYQKSYRNGKRTIFKVVLSGNYPGDPGESVTLTSAASNQSAQTVTGPGGAAKLGGVSQEITQLGGWQPVFVPTATAGVYNLQFWNGTTELTAEAYPAAISGGVLVVGVDHDLQGL
jgi:hypothetical protein